MTNTSEECTNAEVEAWQRAASMHQDEFADERKRHILTGVNLDMARSEAAFWKRLFFSALVCIVFYAAVVFAAR